MTDCDGEASETNASLEFAKDCGYKSEQEYEKVHAECIEDGRMLGAMILNPSKFIIT